MSQRNTRSHSSPLVPGLLDPPIIVGDEESTSPRITHATRNRSEAFPFPPSPSTAPNSQALASPRMSSIDMEALKAVAEAAAAAAATSALNAMQIQMRSNQDQLTQSMASVSIGRKKPEIPPFNKKHIEIWLKRIESAFDRENITSPKDKFSHLESKIGVDEDPKISEFLYGAKTQDKWNEFVAYLRQQYGRSTEQKASSVLDGTPREGRRPSQLLAVIKDKAADVTLDQIFKQMVVRQLPPEVQRNILESTEGLDAEATAQLADKYFNKEGRPIHSSAASVNFLQTEEEEEADYQEDVDSNVHAVGPRFRPQRQFTQAFTTNTQRRSSQSRSNFNRQRERSMGRQNRRRDPSTSASTSASASSQPPRQFPPKTGNNGWICQFHRDFGDAARKCQPGCSKAPKARASRRT